MSTFEFEGRLYKEAPETSNCNGCAFDGRCHYYSQHLLLAFDAFGEGCGARRTIYVRAENHADIARRIGEEAATYAERAIANKIADALENM